MINQIDRFLFYNKYVTAVAKINKSPYCRVTETSPNVFILHGSTVLKEYNIKTRTLTTLLDYSNTRRPCRDFTYIFYGANTIVESEGRVHTLSKELGMIHPISIDYGDWVVPTLNGIGCVRHVIDFDSDTVFANLERWTPSKKTYSFQIPINGDYSILFVSIRCFAYCNGIEPFIVIVDQNGKISNKIKLK